MRVSGGHLAISGRNGFSDAVVREPQSINRNEGVLVHFSYDPGATFQLYLEGAGNLIWGLSNIPMGENPYIGREAYAMLGVDVSAWVNRLIASQFPLQPHTWYYGFFHVDKSNNLQIHIWPDGANSYVATVTIDPSNAFDNGDWRWTMKAYQGTFYIDSYEELSLSAEVTMPTSPPNVG